MHVLASYDQQQQQHAAVGGITGHAAEIDINSQSQCVAEARSPNTAADREIGLLADQLQPQQETQGNSSHAAML